MNVTILVLVVAGALLLAYLTKPRTRARRRPKPGEGMRPPGTPRRRRRDEAGRDGDDSAAWVRIYRDMPASEAHVAVGFLNAQGIPAGIRPSDRGVAAKGPPMSFDVYADPARATEARALLDDA